MVLGMVQTNTWFVINEKTKELILIDPADDAGRIIRKIEADGLKLQGILLTHGHFDHIGAVDDLKAYFKGVQCYAGTSTLCIPAFFAASSFSLSPPIGSTLPRNVISPVMATSARTGISVIADRIAVAIVIPAEGPSFGTAPSGMWICISCSRKNPRSMFHLSPTDRM